MLGAAGWGCTGFFVNNFSLLGLTSLQIACIRVTTAAIIFVIYLLMVNRKIFIISPGDILYFVGTGVVSLSLFTWCNFNAIALSSMSVASVLLYTSPVFVLIMAVFCFGERITAKKTWAVAFTFIGCFLVSGMLESSEAAIEPIGVFFGISAGFAYALYSIFARSALTRYRPETIIAYTFILSSAALLPISNIGKVASVLTNGHTWLLCAGFGLISAALPYLLYTKGLQHLEASKAAVLATVEPIVASIIGVSVFHDAITPLKALGIVMIIASALTLSVRIRKKTHNKTLTKA